MVQTNNTDKLDALFQKGLKPEISDIMGQAIKEVNDKRNEEKVESAKKLIIEAISLKEQMDAEERSFFSKKNEFDKKLGKLMNRINGMMQNKPLDQIEEEEKKQQDEATE